LSSELNGQSVIFLEIYRFRDCLRMSQLDEPVCLASNRFDLSPAHLSEQANLEM
jgi:hypothetical protein